MRRSLLWAGILAAPLVITGCKKKADPEPTPTAEPAPPPAPAVSWSWGPANFNGSRDAGTTGTLTVRFEAKNDSSTGLVLNTVALQVLDASGEKACGGKASDLGKAAQGASVSGQVDLSCDYTKLPAEGKLSAKATAMYTVGGESKEDKVKVDFAFKR